MEIFKFLIIMLKELIEQLYRIAKLLEGKKLVDKDSEESGSDTKVKFEKLYMGFGQRKYVAGGIIDESCINDVTSDATLNVILPDVVDEIKEYIDYTSSNLSFLLFVRTNNGTETFVSIFTDSSKLYIQGQYSGSIDKSNINSIDDILNLYLESPIK